MLIELFKTLAFLTFWVAMIFLKRMLQKKFNKSKMSLELIFVPTTKVGLNDY